MDQGLPKTTLELPPGFLPLRQAAAWAGVSTRTLKRWIEKGLPKYQATPRGKVLIRLAEIEAFLCNNHRTRAALKQVGH